MLFRSLKRDRRQKHKQELTKLERQAEGTFETVNGLNRAKTAGASVFAYIFGCIATLVLGGGMCLTMLTQNNIPAFVGGIILGIAGIAPTAFGPTGELTERMNLKTELEKTELEYMERAYQVHKNVREAARYLSMDPATFSRRRKHFLEKYGSPKDQ